MKGYRTLYRNVVLPMHCVLRGRSTLRWYRVATRQQCLSQEELAALQRQKLAALVRHCAANVPFYRDLFQARGMKPEHVEDISILRDAGIGLGKQEVRAAGNSLISKASKGRLLKSFTSGSTGEPACFYKNMDAYCQRQAIKFRAEEWIGKPIGTRTSLIWGRLAPGHLHIRAGRFLYWWYQNYQFLSAFDIAPEQLTQYLARMKRFGPEFIESYVTAVYQMAKVMAQQKIAPPATLKGILVGAEQLVEEQRQLIESSFGCPVYNRYGSSEFMNIASECEKREGMHINSDHLLVEVVDENDRPVIDEVGEIVVTDLDNYDMPLIRYRIGDRGILSSRQCSCGLPFPMLSSINGRMSERLLTPSGREVHDIFFVHSLMRIPGVARFQVIQKSLEVLQVNLTPDQNAERDAILNQARAGLSELQKDGVNITFNFVDTIPLTDSGKLQHFVSEIPRGEIRLPAPRLNKPMLRVAHVALQLDRGGLEKLLVEFARHSDRSRFDLRFISITQRGTLAEEIEASGWAVTAMNEPPGLRPMMVMRLARLLKSLDVDVVHTHNTKPLLYAGPAARLSRIPTVVHTCHGQRCGSNGRRTAMFVLASRLADKIICVSQDSARMRLRETIPQSRVATIWNGIDVSRFTYQGPQRQGPALLAARLSPEKDIETLLRATAIAVQTLPSFRLQIAGDGERSSALKQLSRELNIAQNVTFLGEISDVPEALKRASMFVLPSLTEGISLSILEAMASGLPVIATRVGGNPEIVSDEHTGLLVPVSDPRQLAAAMMRLWCDPDLGRQMGLSGRSRVEDCFDVRTTVANYESLYEHLAENAAGDPSEVRAVTETHA